MPFVLQFYGHPSSYLWDDDEGVTHEIRQGEGGEQGDAMMPLLYALGQHQGLRSVQFQLRRSQGLLACHDDIYVVTSPERTCEVHAILREALLVDPQAKLWLGDLAAPPEKRGIHVLGAPVGTDAYVRAHLQDIVDSHQILLGSILAVPDLQSAWVLLLYCAANRANCFLRVCLPDSAESFAVQHDKLFVSIDRAPHRPTWERGSLPLHMGGVGLRSASRSSRAACWGSWADCLATIRARHVHVADTMAAALSDPPASATHLVGVAHSRDLLTDAGFESPDWSSLLFGQRHPHLYRDPCVPGHGWQFFLPLSRWRFVFKEVVVWPRPPTEQALMRSQSGPMAGLPLSRTPWSNLFVFTPEVFRVLFLLRRLWLPLPPASRNCRCGRVHSTSLATTAQLAREEESWPVGVRPLCLLPLRFVVKLVVAP